MFGDELALVVTGRLVHGGGRDVKAVLEGAVLFRPALERVEIGAFPERGRALVLRLPAQTYRANHVSISAKLSRYLDTAKIPYVVTS